jgi:anti-sigma regulatory factor (Ser/Thr protein kinase)
MNTLAPPRPTLPTGCQVCRIRLPMGAAAAAEARRQLRAAVDAWDVHVDHDVAVLLTSDLVTNAVRHEAGETVTLVITCSPGQLRVEVHGTSTPPAQTGPPTDAEIWPGLILVATLSDEWGFYRIPAGKVVFFTLFSAPEVLCP